METLCEIFERIEQEAKENACKVKMPNYTDNTALNPLGNVVRDALATVLDGWLRELEAHISQKISKTEAGPNELRIGHLRNRNNTENKKWTDQNRVMCFKRSQRGHYATEQGQVASWDDSSLLSTLDDLGG
uniref:Reverse transcriptase domain-containing protein n=1 Tax=Romanomermis culicivorax TaxID=13658 RepID=A0A915KQE8_ROMCU